MMDEIVEALENKDTELAADRKLKAELTDAQAVVVKEFNEKLEEWHYPNLYQRERFDAYKNKMVMQAIDAAPVRHGRWEECDYFEPCVHGFGTIRHANAGVKCTNCVNVFKKELLWKDNYCPNCGADMRKVSDAEE